ncbi:hypothetical protein Plhal304r1_c031g0101671 [Plasmopara halstedii]
MKPAWNTAWRVLRNRFAASFSFLRLSLTATPYWVLASFSLLPTESTCLYRPTKPQFWRPR